jgi:phage/plasmid-associated DNA primase
MAIQKLALDLLCRCYAEGKDGEFLFRFGTAADQRNTVATLQPLAGPGPLARTSPPKLIAFAEGTYDLQRRVLVAHSPHHGTTFAVDAPWRGLQSEPPPKALEFVDRCYGIDALPIVRTLVRWAIDPTIRYGEAFHLLGDSQTGKGLLLSLVQSLFPAHLTSSLSHPALLETPERMAQHVIGRRLVLFPDCPPRPPRHTSGHMSGWYSLVVNEPVTARRLHATDTWTGITHVRTIIASTTQLQLSDGRDGYLTRVLTLPTIPRTGEKDPAIRNALLGDTNAHRELRAHLAGWALAMSLEDVGAVLDRNDPAGILRETAAELSREADPPSQWADLALVPHTCGAQAAVTDQDWQEFFDCYLLWCRRVNNRHEGSRSRFQGQIRTVLGPDRCLPRGKGPRPAHLNLPRLDAGFALRQGLVETSMGEPRINAALLRPGSLEVLAAIPPVERPEP